MVFRARKNVGMSILSAALLAGPAIPAGAQEAVQTEALVAREVAPLTDGETKRLQALVIEVIGQPRWRPSAEDDWRIAKVNDLLDPGAEVTTDFSSKLGLRIGHNATARVDRLTRFLIPEAIQQGDQLVTRAAVPRGRVDFKVDHVGLTNDFEVLTPSTTLAVRGTGMAVKHGALRGTQILGANFNTINAMEVSYFLRNQRTFVSTGRSSELRLSQANNALFDTVGPPPDASIASSGLSTTDAQQNVKNVSAVQGVRDQRAQLYGNANQQQISQEIGLSQATTAPPSSPSSPPGGQVGSGTPSTPVGGGHGGGGSK